MARADRVLLEPSDGERRRGPRMRGRCGPLFVDAGGGATAGDRRPLTVRILSLSNSPLDPTLGSGKTVLRWSEGLRRHGHECHVLGSDSLLAPPWSRRPGKRFWLALSASRV